MSYIVPSEFVTKMVDAGESKIYMSTRDTLIRAFMAGAILALAAAFAITVAVETGVFLIGAILFPIGFCMPGLGMKPGIGCEQHPLGGLFHRPAFRSGKVVAEETRDGGLAGNLADIAGADAVGDGNGDAFGDQLVALWHQ